jgi:hypothetical protein
MQSPNYIALQGSHVTMWIAGSVYCGFSFGDCICIYMAICEYALMFVSSFNVLEEQAAIFPVRSLEEL